MQIHFNPETLHLSKSKVITSDISIKNYDSYFPESDWNDCVVVLIAAWLENINIIKKNPSISLDFLFMDGPFSFKIHNSQISFYNGNDIYETYILNFEVFFDALINVAKRVIFEIDKKEWNSKEVEILRNLLEK